MDQVITYDKSLQQRLQEYNNALSGYDVLPVSSLQKEWGFYLELTVDPNGWQAVWKIQRKTCEAFNIPFPSLVLVFALNVDFQDLTAMVKVLAVQDDIHIPDRYCVPLIQLWPTKNQDKTIALNLPSTSNSLDMLRFFYLNLLMPWDHEDDECVDWKTSHLESRLRLYYDMRNGVLPRVTSEHLCSLITEARRLQVKQEALESELAEDERFDEHEVNSNNARVQTLMELRVRMMEIKAEVDILENPMLRSAIIKKHKDMSLGHDDTKQNIWIIYNEGTAKECIQFLTKVQVLYPNEVLKLSPQLFLTLDCANSNDIFILNESSHEIKSSGALENGGILRGVSDAADTILTTQGDDVMLDFQGENVLLENLTIQATTPQCAIIVRRGQLTLSNCKLIGDGKSSTHQGIIVLSGGSLQIINCDISHFGSAIIGNSGSEIIIENTEIYDCNFGLKIYDNCVLNATKATIRNCKDYGICVETENNVAGDHPKIGDFDTLNIVPKLQMEFVTGKNNVKGDAVINQKSKLQAMENLFENPDSDPTVCFESDEEMDIQNTIIENNRNGKTSPVTI